jgi:hypothetical protein
MFPQQILNDLVVARKSHENYRKNERNFYIRCHYCFVFLYIVVAPLVLISITNYESDVKLIASLFSLVISIGVVGNGPVPINLFIKHSTVNLNKSVYFKWLLRNLHWEYDKPRIYTATNLASYHGIYLNIWLINSLIKKGVVIYFKDSLIREITIEPKTDWLNLGNVRIKTDQGTTILGVVSFCYSELFYIYLDENKKESFSIKSIYDTAKKLNYSEDILYNGIKEELINQYILKD